MNYFLIYENLCNRAKDRVLDGYTEQHHITPKCIGGNDTDDNLVYLTAEEHYLAHQLLVKMYPENRKLAYAANLLSVSGKNLQRSCNKQYGWLKRKVNEARKEFRHSDETKEKMSATRRGVKHSDEWVEKIAEANRGRVGANSGKTFTTEHRDKISKAHTGKVLSEETKQKIKEARSRQVTSDETRAKMSASHQRRLLLKK